MFIFEDNDEYDSLYDFAKDLAEFLGGKGLEAEIVGTVEDASSKRVLYVTRKKSVDTSK